MPQLFHAQHIASSVSSKRKRKRKTMITFETYYISQFQQDINKFFETIPDESKFHEDIEQKRIYSIQYERLTPTKSHIDFLDKTSKELFGIALFFTVLTDMVCYTYYNENYLKFQSLTYYPKFIGNCLSWCRHHIHPKEIFYAMNQGRNENEQFLTFNEGFLSAKKVMETEITNFFQQYLQEVNAIEFWERCEKELPY